MATTAVSASSQQVDTTSSPQFTGVEVGAASDTTLTRSGAGILAVEGNVVHHTGGADVPVTDGGTGASTAAAARTNLSLGAGWTSADFANGVATVVTETTELLTIAAAATTTSNIVLPANRVILGVTSRVTVQPGGTVSYDLGVGGATTHFGTGISTTANTTNANAGINGSKVIGGSTVALLITPDGTPSDTVGRIRLSILYIDLTPPTG